MTSNQDQSPFKILHNYRSTSSTSSKLRKTRPIRKASDHTMPTPSKKHRKMTEYEPPQPKILEEEPFDCAQIRAAYSEAQVLSRNQFNLESYDNLGPQMMPFQLGECQLSPLEISSVKERNFFQGEEV